METLWDTPDPNHRQGESVTDLAKTITEKVQLLSQASSPQEAQDALLKPGPKPAPKTLNHALARAAHSASMLLEPSDPLATALEKYALAAEKVGDARLQQDAHVVNKFNHAFNTTLNTNINFAIKARKNVENARLSLDAAKSKAKGTPMNFPFPVGQNARRDPIAPEPEQMTEEQRVAIETAEDEFVGCTEEAVGVMQNVLDTPEPLRNLADLIAAQMEYHKRAYEIYSELAPIVDSLQVEQEVCNQNPHLFLK